MFIQLNDGRRLNLIYLSDCFLGKHDKTIVIFYLTNGTKLIEYYASEEEAKARVTEMQDTLENSSFGGGLVQKDTRADFPEKGSVGTIYIAKDTGQTYYWDKETETYITTGTAGRTGVYSTEVQLPATIGAMTTINKADLEVIIQPTVDYSEGSEVIGSNNVHATITSSNDKTVTVKTIADLVIDSFRQVVSLSDLPKQGIANILYFVKNIDEFRVWDDELGEYVEPYHPIELVDVPVEEARLDTLYIVGSSIKYTTDNMKWNYVTTVADTYQTNTEYYKDKLLYLDNTLVKVREDYTSSNNESVLVAFEEDIENGKLEVIVTTKMNKMITYDLTDQLDGVKQTFTISNTISKSSSVMVFYAGQYLVRDVNYTLDVEKHTLTTLFQEAPTAEEDRHLILMVGDIVSENFIDKDVTDATDGNLVAKTEISQEADALVINKVDVNVNDLSSKETKVILKSSTSTVEFNLTDKDGVKEIDIASVCGIEIFQNAITFDGKSNTFKLPEKLDTEKPIMISVNGVTQTEGSDNDYVIDRTAKTITFTLTFEENSNNVILNFK